MSASSPTSRGSDPFTKRNPTNTATTATEMVEINSSTSDERNAVRRVPMVVVR